MNYEGIIKTVSTIIDSDDIISEGLTLTYELDDVTHKQIDEDLYRRVNGTIEDFEHQDKIEIEISGIIIKFVKK